MFEGGFDGGEGGEVDFDESDVGGWDGGGDVGDEGVGAVRVAAGEVDFGRVVFCEGEDGGGADAGGASSQEDNLASEVGQFLVGIEIEQHDGTFAKSVEQSIKT